MTNETAAKNDTVKTPKVFKSNKEVLDAHLAAIKNGKTLEECASGLSLQPASVTSRLTTLRKALREKFEAKNEATQTKLSSPEFAAVLDSKTEEERSKIVGTLIMSDDAIKIAVKDAIPSYPTTGGNRGRTSDLDDVVGALAGMTDSADSDDAAFMALLSGSSEVSK